MSIFDDMKSIHSGVKKARRDYAKILAFNAEHDARHEVNPDYECHDFHRDFHANLGSDVHPRINLFEAASYKSTSERLVERHLRRNGGEHEGPQVGFLTVEMDGGETPQDLIEKIKRAVRDKEVFDEMVSETKNSKNNKKGGK